MKNSYLETIVFLHWRVRPSTETGGVKFVITGWNRSKIIYISKKYFRKQLFFVKRQDLLSRSKGFSFDALTWQARKPRVRHTIQKILIECPLCPFWSGPDLKPKGMIWCPIGGPLKSDIAFAHQCPLLYQQRYWWLKISAWITCLIKHFWWIFFLKHH